MRYHFSGIAGVGMNPLARLMRARGHDVQGSDRSFDQGQHAAARADLEALGIRVLAQDGAAVQPGIDRLVYSAAVEPDTPELRAARLHGIAALPRPRLLAEVVDAGMPGVAVAGTSGKSTVVGMLAWILRRAQRAATVLGGAALAGEGATGCFALGPADAPVVAEACESDGTLTGYRPGIGVVHNVSRDHAELPELRAQFETFAAQCRLLLVNAACGEASRLQGRERTVAYGAHGAAELPLEAVTVGPNAAVGVLSLPDGELEIRLRQPGLHNLENAAAAAAIALQLDVAPADISAALAGFPGVHRRFEVLGVSDTGIRVVDDYAHNGEKIRAALSAAQAGCGRLVALFQPHGFGPARFLRPELKELLPRVLRPQDRWCYLPIFYAGGTVAQDISSADLARDLPALAAHCASHREALAWVAEEARPGDTVLVMGARDPQLPRLARAIADLV